MTPKAEAILEDIMTEGKVFNRRSILGVLEDGEALAALGLTDEDQGAVEELHAIYAQAVVPVVDAEARE